MPFNSSTLFIVLSMFILGCVLSVIVFLHYKNKKENTILLDKILNNKLDVISIFITEPQYDGYQSIQVSYLDDDKPVIQQLASHFEVEEIFNILQKNNIPVTGNFIRL